MGSQVKKKENTPLMFAISILAIALIAFAIFRVVSGGGREDEASLETPPPREGSPDFGGLPEEHIIGGDGRPKAAKPASGGN